MGILSGDVTVKLVRVIGLSVGVAQEESLEQHLHLLLLLSLRPLVSKFLVDVDNHVDEVAVLRPSDFNVLFLSSQRLLKEL